MYRRASLRAAFVAATVLSTVIVVAGESGMQLQITSLGGRAKASAPILLNLKFLHSRTTTLRGRLELVVREHATVLLRYRTEPLILFGDSTQFRIYLPPLAMHGRTPSGDSPLHVEKTFVTEDKRIPLGYDLLYVGGHQKGALVIGVVLATGGPKAEVHHIASALRLDPHFKGQRKNLFFQSSLMPLAPEWLPRSYIGCTAFDVLVLPQTVIPSLNPEQINALTHWTRAGGSLVLVKTEQETPAEAETFFRGLQIEPVQPSPAPYVLYNAGLGRVTRLPRSITPKEKPWRRVIAHVWRCRSELARDFANTGKWEIPDRPPAGMWMPRHTRNYGHVNYKEMADQQFLFPVEMSGQLVQEMLPRHMTLIPLWAIILIMAVFIVAVGPGDYFLLGRLRKRKWTWLLLPTLALVTTGFTLNLADRYMGRTDHSRSLNLIDLAPNGEVLRTNRYKTLFAGKTVTIHHTGSNTQIVPSNPMSSFNRYGYYGYTPSGDITPTPAPWVTGRYPEAYRFSQTLRQWTPVMVRSTPITGAIPPCPAEWETLNPTWLRPGHAEALRRWSSAFLKRPQDCLYVYRGNHYWTNQSHQWSDLQKALSNQQERYYYGWDYSPHRMNQPVSPLDLFELSTPSALGIRSILSRLSPDAGSGFDDLAIYDPAEAKSLVVVVLYRDDNYWIYRTCL